MQQKQPQEANGGGNENENNSNNNKKNVVIFEARKPYLSELYDSDPNIRSICQFGLITTVGILTTLIMRDCISAGRLYWRPFSTDTFHYPNTCQILGAIGTELVYHLLVLTVHPMFNLWIKSRSACGRGLVDVLFVCTYVVGVLFSFVFNVWVCAVYFRFPGFIRIILTIEQVRMVLKSYSFIRENAYKVLYPWHKDDTTGPAVWYEGQMSPRVGSFGQYCYYLFAPTLLYRDHYPRNNRPICGRVVVTNLCLVVLGFMVFRAAQYGSHLEDFRWSSVLYSFTYTTSLSLIVLLTFTIQVTHGWMNMWAELLRFADRRYYENWWACAKYQEYYRIWNIIPYHFNHQYVYKDIRKVTGSQLFATFLLISMSSVVHEYIIAVSMGFMLPMLTIFFAGIGVFVQFFRLGSKYILLSLSFGGAMTFLPNFIEDNARTICAREETWMDLIYPRSIECFVKYNFG